MSYMQIEKNPSLTEASLLQYVCSPLEQLGIHFFGYTAIDSEENAFCLGSKPEYAIEYLRHNHAANDIHSRIKKPINKYYYEFWDYLPLDSRMKEIYSMAAQFNQGHTLTISQHTDKITHCFHFSGHLQDIGINQRYLEKLNCLHAFIVYFKNCLQSIPELAAVYQHPTKMSNNDKRHKMIMPITSDSRELITSWDKLDNTIYFKNGSHYLLNNQELDCLKWLRLGKTTDMIAKIMNVSTKTVERYVESSKRKFNCFSLFQLGEKISSSGLSHFLDRL